MTIDLFGIVWLSLCSALLFVHLWYLVGLMIVSTIFQTSSVIGLGSLEMSPLLVTELFFLLKSGMMLMHHPDYMLDRSIPRWIKIFLVFTGFSVLVTIFMPYLFTYDVRVLLPKFGIDDGVAMRGVPLQFTTSNIAQIVLLLVDVAVLLLVFSFRKMLNFRLQMQFLYAAIALVIVFGLWRLVSKFVFALPFPTLFFDNNTSHALMLEDTVAGQFRLIANFTEASYAGQFLATAVVALLADRRSIYNTILLIGSLVCLLLTLSGTAYAGIVIGTVVWAALSGKRQLFTLLFFSGIAFAVFYISGLFDMMVEILTTKAASESGIIRSMSNTMSFQMFLDTYGLGVGMGSNRCSSFFFNMLAGVGLIGTVLYAASMGFLFRNLYQQIHNKAASFLFFWGVVFTITQVLGIPDLSNPVFWAWMFLVGMWMEEDRSATTAKEY